MANYVLTLNISLRHTCVFMVKLRFRVLLGKIDRVDEQSIFISLK